MNRPPDQINVQEEFSKKLTVHTSLDQEVIVTTADKVRLCLIAHRDRMTARREWLLPLGILTTLITALIAATFRNFILDAEVWEAVFVIAALVSGIWLIYTVIKAIKYWKKADVENIVERLKAHSPNVSGTENPEDGEEDV